MTIETKLTQHCLGCGWVGSEPFVSRGDGVMLVRCQRCRSIYLERIPVRVADLYTDNYFALTAGHAELNQDERIGYEGSYENTYLDSEFYWAFRLADFVANSLQGDVQARRCLDIGAATGRLLNVFRAAGYKTHGIEFSDPARGIADGRGHVMTNQSVETLLTEHAGFEVVTALEVIEHVEDLRGFFGGINRVMADNGIFLGYFPSADERWFGPTSNYHWLNNSLEHLIYPSEDGIRRAMAEAFGDNVFIATFLTVQGKDVIPFSLVIALKNPVSAERRALVAELFRQLNYLTDRELAFADVGPAALAAGWKAAIEEQTDAIPADLPFVAALLCSKFGTFAVPRFLMQCGFLAERLTDKQVLDFLAMAMHQGSIHFMENLLKSTTERSFMPSIRQEFHRLADDYQKSQLSIAEVADVYVGVDKAE